MDLSSIPIVGTILSILKLIDSMIIAPIIAWIKRRREKKAYKEYTDRKFEYIDFPKTNSLVPLLPLEEIYIKIRVEIYNPFLPPQSQGNKQSDNDFVSIVNNLYDESRKKRKPLRLAILGPAGSGKTTLMKWLMRQCVSRKRNFFSRFTPFYISLDDPDRDPADICQEDNINNLVQNKLRNAGLKYSFFDAEFKAGKILFLFDGLNDNTTRVIKWIENQGFGQNSVLITIRKTGFDNSCLPKFNPPMSILSIQNFNLVDIKNFLEKWFHSVEINILGNADRPSTAKAEKKALGKCHDLMDLINNKDSKIYLQLSENPLCLTTIALVFYVQGQLPKKLPDLCREIFRVTIKVLENKHFPATDKTSVEKIMEYLSYIATLLLKNNRKEMGFSEIYAPFQKLVSEVELSCLLNDMVEKTGLIYKVDNQYGFTHVTFQEYLVAWHFAVQSQYADMLKYRNNDDWVEVFKLFVNMAEKNVTRQFFNEIIQGLLDKEYWKQIRLWDNCLLNIADENLQNEIEIQFAGQILHILSGVRYNKKAQQDDERFIIYLYIPYPQFKHAMRFKDEAWKFFNQAEHPLVQTFGSSLLHDISRKAPGEALKLVDAIKIRIIDLGKLFNLDHDNLFDFLYRNHNNFSLLIALRRNLLDFTFALEKLKSPHPFIRYLFLANFCNLLDILDTFELMALPELKETLEFLETRRFFNDLNFSTSLDFWAVRDFMTLQDFVELQTTMNLAEIMDFPSEAVQDSLQIYAHEFLKKLRYVQIIEKPMRFTEKIKLWVNHTYKKLNSLPDKKLLKFFPGTTSAEIDQFRTDCAKLIDIDKNSK